MAFRRRMPLTIGLAGAFLTSVAAGRRDLHFAPADGRWRWFLDCGNPR
jgi:hypothetical protein